MADTPFLLASASPRRLVLLRQAGYVPAAVIPADLDETPLPNETPAACAARLAHAKALKVAGQHPASVILAADTVVALGRRILPRAEDAQTAAQCLRLLQGRRHRVLTAVTLMAPGRTRTRRVMTQVRLRRLTDRDIAAYVATGEWRGKAGGYGIQGVAECFIPFISGSYSNVVGLPLAETCQLLRDAGIAPSPQAAPREQAS